MPIARDSLLFKLLRSVDTFWISLDGFVPDFERLQWVYNHRPLFSTEGLIKFRLSSIPGRDLRLKEIAAKVGGWEKMLSQEPTEQLYWDLQKIGISRADFDRSRRYASDPISYMNQGRL